MTSDGLGDWRSRLGARAFRAAGLLQIAALVMFALSGCAGKPDVPRSTLIANATLIDGTGAPPRAAAVRIAGDRIAAVGDLEIAPGDTLVDARGLVLAPHPRGFGSYPRFLGRYVRERGIMDLATAVHKSSGLAAAHMGIRDRGVIRPGMLADLVLFDAERVLDRATPEAPHALSVGIHRVWVNGDVVYEDGRTTGRLPGRVIRRAGVAGSALLNWDDLPDPPANPPEVTSR